MPRMILLLDGRDSKKAVAELLANIQYDKLEVNVMEVENPWTIHVDKAIPLHTWDKEED